MSADNDQHVELEGTVVFETKGCFKVLLDSGEEVNVKPSGKMRKNKIQIITGDHVVVALGIYDMTNGRIVRRVSSGSRKTSATDRKKVANTAAPVNKEKDWS